MSDMNFKNFNHTEQTSELPFRYNISSRQLDIPFLGLNVVLGTTGTLVNGFVLYILVSMSSKGKSLFIVSQLICDLAASIFIIITYSWKMAQVKLFGTTHKILCLLIGSEACMWVCLNSSVTNLVFVSIERFVLVKFPLWHRNHQREWMWIAWACIVFLWIDSFLRNIPTTWVSTDFSGHNCGAFLKWPSQRDGDAFTIYYTLVVYVIPVIIFIFSYANIINIIRKNVKVEPGQTDVKDAKDDKYQMTILKAMIFITLTFVILWFPVSIYFILLNIGCCSGISIDTKEWHIFLFFGMSTCCINPFIYGFKSGSIKMFYKSFKKWT